MVHLIFNRSHFLLSLAFLSFAVTAQNESYVPVTDDILLNPDPEDWLSFRRTLDSWGFSPLNQIDRENVADLELVWSSDLHEGTLPSVPIQEGTPLVYDGVMYMPNPGDVVRAHDAASGQLRW